ncbi:MAG: hypothetical protein J6J62_06510 [Oscillospiraceae bacterium]|nr:hypothetical protein [Oscillospiraceae bacterium]
MSYIENAKALKAAIDSAAAVLTDEQAVKAKAIYPTWTSLIGTTAKVGQRFRHGDTLYKVRTAHTFSAEWVPGVETASLYTAIDVEHSGTIDDPIPWVPPMELVSGKYYTQFDKLYECIRDSDIPLSYALADIVGTYVEVVRDES